MPESINIIGAGLSGLSAAYKLEAFGFSPTIYEASDSCGGHMKSDFYQGYILDHGLHLVLSTYESLFDICPSKELEVNFFPPGIMFQKNKEWVSVLNPMRGPLSFDDRSPFLFDFMKLGKLYLKYNPELEDLSIAELFQKIGLSNEVIERVLRPFFAGVFLDPNLQTSGKAFQHILPFFVKGRGGLPRKGIQAIPNLLVGKLKRTKIRYNTRVKRLENGNMILESGETVASIKTILALPASAASKLISLTSPIKFQQATHCYFSIDEGLFIPSPFIYLIEDKTSPIIIFAVLNLIQSSYAPKGKYLFSVLVLNAFWQNHPELEKTVAEELGRLFNVSGFRFEHLKTYHFPQALPVQSHPPPFYGNYCYDRKQGIYLCGELVDFPSYNNAVISGKKAAEALYQDLRNPKI